MKTRITDLFGIEHPIVQGGLMWIATAELTSAVANAGAMGFMTALSHETPDGLRNEIRKCRDMTDKPFGINLTFLPSLRQPDYPAYLQVCAEEGIEFIETAGRNPEPYMPHIKTAGMKVIHKCTSVRHALKAQVIGCDAVSIDGFECAGHPGEDDVTSLVLLPVTVDALDIPIVASGGFGDGRGLVAALALGADGMNMGTRFVATKEAPVHDAVKQAILDHNETDTTLIMRSLRNTERVLRNKTAEKVIEIESTGHATIQDIVPYVSGRRGLEEVIRNGNIDEGTMAVGQIIGLIHDIPTVGELIDRIMAEATRVISDRLANLT
ncbi:nitronate monooxygenase [bacterium BMS3Abin02]|nr:nitronate monooxygenase [bacterium BMS3Abin02]GBE22168.1 nitronate monooxygenase [bacterium BMS3Bbin01]HDH24826.1 nitronate monooxygenase [Actinomycetota bacterium]HDL49990.1 nitronate monooxygenase [Actinomycetota bacterium]